MNAVSAFRLFTRLFLGERRTGFTAIVDALPRERWALAIGMLFVVLWGESFLISSSRGARSRRT